jgi:hypothetical protein
VGADERAYRVLVENPRERDNLEDLSHRWKDNYKIHLQEI